MQKQFKHQAFFDAERAKEQANKTDPTPKRNFARGANIRTKQSSKGNKYQILSIHADKFIDWIDANTNEDGFVNLLVNWPDESGIQKLTPIQKQQ